MKAVVAYIPVLHEGYRRFLDAHARDKPLYLIGPELHADHRPLAKDIRALDADEVAPAIAAWGIEVHVLDRGERRRRSPRATRSSRCPPRTSATRSSSATSRAAAVRYDTVFLRWDKPRVVDAAPAAARSRGRRERPAGARRGRGGAQHRLVAPGRRRDPLRRRHRRRDAQRAPPAPAVAYVVGDPRSNFFKGVHLELSTATHAEARLIAEAAREGRSTAGAVLYVTDFPCPPCAKLIAGAGIARLRYRTGYAVLDGQDVLDAAGVEIVLVS